MITVKGIGAAMKSLGEASRAAMVSSREFGDALVVDGEVVTMKQVASIFPQSIAPPLHPNCRSVATASLAGMTDSLMNPEPKLGTGITGKLTKTFAVNKASRVYRSLVEQAKKGER